MIIPGYTKQRITAILVSSIIIYPIFALAQANISTSASTVLISQKLSQGMRGRDVLVLQRFFARDTSIYPEASITGYFGPATARAVKRYQTKLGLEAVGYIGPKTLAAINKEIDATNPVLPPLAVPPKPSSTNQINSTSAATATLPPPPIPPIILPTSTASRVTPTPVPTPVTTPPDYAADNLKTSTSGLLNLTNPSVLPATSTARVTWNTNTPTNSNVNFGLTPERFFFVFDPGTSENHSVFLSSLTPGKLYYYQIISSDSNQNMVSYLGTFTTIAE